MLGSAEDALRDQAQPLPEAQDAADREGGWRAPRHGYAGTAERM